MTIIERRSDLRPVEFRSASDGAPPVAAGYAYKFDTLSRDLGGFVERIATGGGQRSLMNDDTLALANHDKSLLLGRRSAGTLRTSIDSRGAAYEIDMPDTTVGRDWSVSLERRDVVGSSFGFFNAQSEWDDVDGVIIRTLIDFDVRDVGPVTTPAYDATEAALRDLAESRSADPADVLAAASEGRLARFLPKDKARTVVAVAHWAR